MDGYTSSILTVTRTKFETVKIIETSYMLWLGNARISRGYTCQAVCNQAIAFANNDIEEDSVSKSVIHHLLFSCTVVSSNANDKDGNSNQN